MGSDESWEVWLQYLNRTIWLPSHNFWDLDGEFIHEEDDDGGEDKMLGCLRGSLKVKKLLSGLGCPGVTCHSATVVWFLRK